MIQRRSFSAMLLGFWPGTGSAAPRKTVESNGNASPRQQRFAAALRDIERAARGRLGVFIVDTASGASISYRADERFPMCSTFKLMACALALQRVDRAEESLDRRMAFRAGDLVPFSPVTGDHVDGSGMTLGELCHATITTSDNTAANLILASYGGPARLTAFARSIGDRVTRLDRIEPALNESRPGDPRDTTSPRAMLESVRKIVLGNTLSPTSRDVMQGWLKANTTGGRRLKAGVPADWLVGDKTGASDAGTSNDIGVIWPPDRAPFVVTAFLTQSGVPAVQRDGAIAAVAQLLPELARG